MSNSDLPERVTVARGGLRLPSLWVWFLVVMLLAGAAGLGGYFWHVSNQTPVVAVRVEPSRGLKMPDVSVSGLLGKTRDMVVVVATQQGEVSSAIVRDKVIGGGLDFRLHRPIARYSITEIALFDPRDEGLLDRTLGYFRGPKPLDRVDHVGMDNEGAIYRFLLVVEPVREHIRKAAIIGIPVLLLAALFTLILASIRRRPRTP